MRNIFSSLRSSKVGLGWPLCLIACIAVSLLSACSDSGDDDPIIDTFSVSPTSASVDKDGGSLAINVKCSKVPTATSDASWITQGSRSSTSDGYIITMTVAANTEASDRSANITITCGSSTQTVKVTQAAMDVLKIPTTTFKVDDQEQTLSVPVTTNGSPTLSYDGNWVKMTSITTEAYNFQVDANTGAARTLKITFTLGSLTSVVTVEQSQGLLTGTVDPAVTYQTIEGFSASDCWAPAVIGKYWTGSRAGIAELLFSREVVNGQPKGIGLSMWRSNMGGGSWEQGIDSNIGVDNGANGYNYYRRGESYLNDDLTYDWTRCEGQRYFLDQAKEYGVESIVLFSNSPNVQFTRNGKGYSDMGHSSNLKGDCYDDFAAYMAEVAAQYRAWGYPVTHISPVNEPQYTWDGHDQEGSGWTNTEVAKLTKELDAALTNKGLDDVKIVLGEAADWEYAYKTKNSDSYSNCIDAFFNASSTNYVGNLSHVAKVYGGHSYWTDGTWSGMRSVREQAYSKAQANGVSLWQTEWSMLGDGYSEFPGYDNSNEMDIALVMDKVIYNDLTVGNMTSWSFWTSMDVSRWSQLDRFMLIDFTPSGGTYSVQLEGEGSYKANSTLWVLGNYSLFVRPGYKRVSVDITNTDRTFFGTGFISADGNRLVVVVSNLGTSAMSFRLNVKDFAATRVSSYTTTLDKHLAQKTLSTTSNEFALEASSVTTFVFEK